MENIRLSDRGDAVIILDQSLLPNETRYLTLCAAEELREAIVSLRVRGAPAIGIFAACAVYVLAARSGHRDYPAFYEEFKRNRDYLDSARPTAVNLRKMLDRMERVVTARAGEGVPAIIRAMRREARAIYDEDAAMCRAISEYGLTLVKGGDGILTHCNAGALATSRYGTGLGPILLGAERGINFRVYCDETRPLLQGARLTAYELVRAGVDCTLICDSMAGLVMSEGKIDACFVGCDRVAGNGDTANKIGTLGVAVLAWHYGIPFYVFCPSTTVDFNCASGADIVIEQRAPREIRELYFERPAAPPEVKCYNPAFDVTPGRLITAIVTQRGICRAPYEESLAALREEER